MRWSGPLALVSLVGGIALLGLAVSTGGAQVHLLLIVPVVTGTSPLAFLGVLLILAAMVLGFVSLAGRELPATDEAPGASTAPAGVAPTPSKSFGGVVFLGPFPLVFGSNPRMARTMLLLGVVLFVLLVVFYAAMLMGWLRLG